ncbi:hypothetical protein C8A05DRAFT_39648 [Staphylotrichum tortipilum]|uniref:GATA-type domain-containing protein n=1 Tax=Staphylotrichum tortipilum TaxID=2831512 RepID=A0AAN6MAX8_9PEZI|nr:hypothetical protein C8A05DRAFT_39648 [Staphylotrichum longicolle]
MAELIPARGEGRAELARVLERAGRGAVVGLRHEVVHKRGHVVQAYTVFYPGGGKGGKPSFLVAQTRLVKGTAGRGVAAKATAAWPPVEHSDDAMSGIVMSNPPQPPSRRMSIATTAYPDSVADDNDGAADDETDETDDLFAELRTTRCTSWQHELRHLERENRLLAEELTQLMASKKKRKRRKGGGGSISGNSAGLGGTGITSVGGGVSGGGLGAPAVRDCANCHRRDTPEWRRGPSGNRDLCNSCGLRWAKQSAKQK